MKQNRRRRHLRPHLTRSQVNHYIDRIGSALRLFQAEWLLESQRPSPCYHRLRFLHDRIVEMRDEVAALGKL